MVEFKGISRIWGYTEQQLKEISERDKAKAYDFLSMRYGGFDCNLITDKVANATREMRRHEELCSVCKGFEKCARRACVVVTPKSDEATGEIYGFEVGGQECKLLKETKLAQSKPKEVFSWK